MTWYFDPRQNKIDVYDHNGDLVVENMEFSGSWTNDYPPVVEKKMIDIFRDQGHFGKSPVLNVYAGEILLHLLRKDIQEGTPP